MTRSARSQTSSPILAALVALTVVALATLLVGPAATADEQIERVIALQLHDGEPLEVAFEGRLEVGESRQLFTDDGREVLLHRDDDGLHLTIDGETIDLPAHHAGPDGHHYAFIADGETPGAMQIEIEQILGGEGHGTDGHHIVKHMVIGGEGDGEPRTFLWHGDDHPSTADQLEASGALDGLDDDERQRILDALGAIDGERKQLRMVLIEREEESVD